MKISTLCIAFAIAACSGSTRSAPNKHAHSRPLSVDEHLAESERHKRVADAEEAAAAGSSGSRVEVHCGETQVESQTRIGTEPVRPIHPCFTSVTNPSADHLREARENRTEAIKHRHRAAELAEAEAQSCSGLDPSALEHSPFTHREDIGSIDLLIEGGATLGVTVTFKPVKGLSRDWLERALKCHQARAAALGYPSAYMKPGCLCAVPGAEVEVASRNRSLSVSIRGADDKAVATIVGRALNLQKRLAPSRP